MLAALAFDIYGTLADTAAMARAFFAPPRANKKNTELVSANPFDIIGARAAGWKTAWLRRGAVFDSREEFAPDIAADSLAQLPEILP